MIKLSVLQEIRIRDQCRVFKMPLIVHESVLLCNLSRDVGLINKVDMVCLSPVGYGV